MDTKPARSQPIPGLTILISKSGGMCWGEVRHDASGLSVVRYVNKSLPRGVTGFVSVVKEHLSPFDWTVDAETLTATHTPAMIQAIRNVQSYS